MENRNKILNIILIIVIFLSTLLLTGWFFIAVVPSPILFLIFCFSIPILVSFIYYNAVKNKVNSRFQAILLSSYAIIAFEALIYLIMVMIFIFVKSAIILLVIWIALGFVGLYSGCKFYEYIKSPELNRNIVGSRNMRAREFRSKIDDSSDKRDYKYSAFIFFILAVISLVLNHFNLTFGLPLSTLIKGSALIALISGLFFVDKLAFKFYSSIMICLVLLMIFVDFLEKNSYFGLPPDTMRFVLVCGGSTAILVGIILYFKWIRGEF